MYRTVGLLLALSLVSVMCNAPRNNPLDPQNKDYEFGSIHGLIQTYRVPHQPIPQVEVFWEKADRFTHSDDQGLFVFNEVDAENGWMYFRNVDYFEDSVFVEWSGSKHLDIEHYLNAVPVLDSLIFYSSILNLYNDLQLIRLSIQTRITDPDNDLDSVFVICPGLDVRTNLSYNLESRFFVKELSMQDLGINSPEAVIGHAFNIYAKDRLNNCLRLSSSVIKRIIKEQVELKSPGGHEIVGPTPVLQWEPVAPGFPLKYRVEIYTDEMNLIWFRDGISSGTSSLTVDSPLPSDKYRWAIWIIDEFQNRSRSKYKSFEVQSK